MASQSLPIPVPQTRAWMRAGARAINRVLPLWTVVAILAALLILFGWLHLVLALQTTSTNRTIQERTAVLEKLERDQAVIVREIAAASAPGGLEDRARLAGFRTARPMYLILQPVQANSYSEADLEVASEFTSSAVQASEVSTLLEAVIRDTDQRLESESAP